jgi:hypothetical protein
MKKEESSSYLGSTYLRWEGKGSNENDHSHGRREGSPGAVTGYVSN